MATVAERVAALRKARNMSQRKLGEEAGLDDSYVSRIESGSVERPALGTLLKISGALGASLLDILAEDPAYREMVELVRELGAGQPSEARTVPVVSSGSTGFHDSKGAPSGIGEETMRVPPDITESRAYGVAIKDDSMFPAFLKGDVAIASPLRQVEDGDYVVSLDNSKAIVVRRLRMSGNTITLECVNQLYPPIIRKKRDGFYHKVLWTKHAE